MTSTQALRNTRLPQRLIVVGGGYIACELGHAYGALGCEVHFLVRRGLLRAEDKDVQQEFTRVFTKKYQVHLEALPTRVEYHGGIFTVTFKDKAGLESKLTADGLLIASGITPNNDTLKLENTDIQLTPGGFIKVDDRLRATVEGIYAMGDCVGNFFFRHSVNFEGEYLFRTVFENKSDAPIKYPPVPHAIFTNPQVAGVGATEQQLSDDGVDYVVGLSAYEKSGMGMALLSDHGFCKLLIERRSRKILGCHIIGEQASNMIHMVIAFMNKEGTLDDLLNMIYIHPALPEIVRNAARKAKTVLEEPISAVRSIV